MIGQINLKNQLIRYIENDCFPTFSIIVGNSGSGRKTLVNFLSTKFPDSLFMKFGSSVDDVRQAIYTAYKTGTNKKLLLFADADKMSVQAKNALLKFCEEPPINTNVIMTLEDENNTLETIRSRGTIFHMDRYTPDEIGSYFYDKYHANHGKDEEEIVRELCDTPGDVDTLVKTSIHEFYDYVQLVVDNIAEVSLANAFKIPSKVALKDDAEGYDLRLFWKAFRKVCIDRSYLHKDVLRYGESILVTSKYLQKLKIKGINKQMLIDNWVLEIRKVWR